MLLIAFLTCLQDLIKESRCISHSLEIHQGSFQVFFYNFYFFFINRRNYCFSKNFRLSAFLMDLDILASIEYDLSISGKCLSVFEKNFNASEVPLKVVNALFYNLLKKWEIEIKRFQLPNLEILVLRVA